MDFDLISGVLLTAIAGMWGALSARFAVSIINRLKRDRFKKDR